MRNTLTCVVMQGANIGVVELRNKGGSIRREYPEMVRAMYEVWNACEYSST